MITKKEISNSIAAEKRINENCEFYRRCITCGGDNVHIDSVVAKTRGYSGSYIISRGEVESHDTGKDCVIIEYWCEEGCRWAEIMVQHKGSTSFVVHELRKKSFNMPCP